MRLGPNDPAVGKCASLALTKDVQQPAGYKRGTCMDPETSLRHIDDASRGLESALSTSRNQINWKSRITTLKTSHIVTLLKPRCPHLDVIGLAQNSLQGRICRQCRW
jgi:hypothetical protein